jgi:hypothetical protein
MTLNERPSCISTKTARSAADQGQRGRDDFGGERQLAAREEAEGVDDKGAGEGGHPRLDPARLPRRPRP